MMPYQQKYIEVKTNANYYLRSINNENNGEESYEFLPLIVNHSDPRSIDTIFNDCEKNGISAIQYLEIIKYIMNLCNQENISCKEFKTKIIAIKLRMAKFSSRNSGVSYPYYPYLLTILDTIINEAKALQVENKLLESAMTNFAPIVPYQGCIRDSKINTASIFDEDKFVYNSKGLKVNDNPADVCNKLHFLHLLIKILDNNPRAIRLGEFVIKTFFWAFPFDILRYQSDFDPLYENTLVGMNLLNIKEKDYTPYQIFYFLNFFINNLGDISTNRAALAGAIDLNLSRKPDMKKVYESIVESDFAASDNPNISHDTDIEKEYETDMYQYLKDTMAENQAQMKDNYNIDTLLNFIYTNIGRFQTNKYTNSLFLRRNSDIEDYSFINNHQSDEQMMVAECRGLYLVMPVIDLADNYKPKVISLDRNNNIEVRDTFTV